MGLTLAKVPCHSPGLAPLPGLRLPALLLLKRGCCCGGRRLDWVSEAANGEGDESWGGVIAVDAAAAPNPRPLAVLAVGCGSPAAAAVDDGGDVAAAAADADSGLWTGDCGCTDGLAGPAIGGGLAAISVGVEEGAQARSTLVMDTSKTRDTKLVLIAEDSLWRGRLLKGADGQQMDTTGGPEYQEAGGHSWACA